MTTEEPSKLSGSLGMAVGKVEEKLSDLIGDDEIGMLSKINYQLGVAEFKAAEAKEHSKEAAQYRKKAEELDKLEQKEEKEANCALELANSYSEDLTQIVDEKEYYSSGSVSGSGKERGESAHPVNSQSKNSLLNEKYMTHDSHHNKTIYQAGHSAELDKKPIYESFDGSKTQHKYLKDKKSCHIF